MKKSRIREIWDYIDGLEQRVFQFQAELDESQIDRTDLAEKITAIRPIAYSVPAIGRAVAQVTRVAETLEDRMSQLAAAQEEAAAGTTSALETLHHETSELRQRGEDIRGIAQDLVAGQRTVQERVQIVETVHEEINELREHGEEVKRASDELTASQSNLERRLGFVEALQHEVNELRRQDEELRRVSQELTAGQHTLEQ